MKASAATVIASLLLLPGVSLAQSSFELTDRNDDGRINKGEFYEAAQQANVFSVIDTNNDNRVDELELEQLEIEVVFSDWDSAQDGSLTSREFYNGIYEYIDRDGDGYLSAFDWDDPDDKGWFGVYDAP